MAFQKPTVKSIDVDIANLSIYIRSVKKFGKTTLFRDVIIEKYGDPEDGCLVQVGMERGAEVLDNINTLHISNYQDAIDFQKWLIEKKGIEHHIKIVAFDTADELVNFFDEQTIRIHNRDNPQKLVKTINAAMGGYNAGKEYSANMMKAYFDAIRQAGIQVWVLAHSKYKNIKDKANVDTEGYMQLTSVLGASYEAALGDIFDVTLTGIIDRNIEVVGSGENTKRYATDAVRKLYLRGTPEIDAGGRFAFGAVPEYMVFDKPNMAADFIKVMEEGMEKSKTIADEAKAKAKSKTKAKSAAKETVKDEAPVSGITEERLEKARAAYKLENPENKQKIKELLDGNKLSMDMDQGTLAEIEKVLGF